jgi:hypothetical protein
VAGIAGAVLGALVTVPIACYLTPGVSDFERSQVKRFD